MCTVKPLICQEFSLQTGALCCVRLRTCYDAGPQVYSRGTGTGHGAVW